MYKSVEITLYGKTLTVMQWCRILTIRREHAGYKRTADEYKKIFVRRSNELKNLKRMVY